MRSEFKSRKNVRVIGIVLKVVLFLSLAAVLSWQLSRQQWSTMQSVQLESPFYLILSLLLVVANQGCEWMKWRIIARQLTQNPRILRDAFFGGIGAGFLTPNGWGNFLGRMVFFRKRERLYILLSSFISNVSQVLPTVFFGAIACLYTTRIDNRLGIFFLMVGSVILLLFFLGEFLIPRKKQTSKRWVRRLHYMKNRLMHLRLPLFLWSFLRFFIFSVQYVLLFMAFGYTDVLFLLLHVWLIFLLTSFVPSLWSGKLLIRETAAVYVFTGTIVTVPDVIVVSLLIWLFNVILPAVISTYVWLPLSKREVHVVD